MDGESATLYLPDTSVLNR